MIGPADFAFWILSILLFAFVAILIAIRKQFCQYLALSSYFIAAVATNLIWILILQRKGFAPSAYYDSYIWGSAALTILLYCAVAGLYRKVLLSERLRRQVSIASVGLAAALALIAWFAAMRSSELRPTYWVVKYDSYLYLASLLLALALLYPGLYQEQVPNHVRQIAIVLAGYFAMTAVQHATWKFAPSYARYTDMSRLLYLWLPMGVAYVFSALPSSQSPTCPNVRV